MADNVMSDPESFITLPPGVVDSGTYRVASPRVAPERPARSTDDIVFFAASPGLAAASHAAASNPDAMSPVPEPAEPAHRAAQQWCLVLPQGVGAKVVHGAVFLGRNPTRTPEWPGAELLPVIDPAKSLSKTHALIEVDADSLWVHDLDSTNGVYIVTEHGGTITVEPGTRAMVPAGSDLELGNYVVRVEYS